MIYKSVQNAADRQEPAAPIITAVQVGNHVPAARLHAAKCSVTVALEMP